jgi:hypothetical protein
MSASEALQLAVINVLKGNAALSEITGGEISQNAPDSFSKPYVTLGPSSFQSENADGLTAREETLQVDCWSEQGGNLAETKRMVDLVYATLHEADLALAEPYAASGAQVVLARSFLDPNQVTGHGVLQVSVYLEDHGP